MWKVRPWLLLSGLCDEEDAEEPIARIGKQLLLWKAKTTLKNNGLELKPNWAFEQILDGNVKAVVMLWEPILSHPNTPLFFHFSNIFMVFY